MRQTVDNYVDKRWQSNQNQIKSTVDLVRLLQLERRRITFTVKEKCCVCSKLRSRREYKLLQSKLFKFLRVIKLQRAINTTRTNYNIWDRYEVLNMQHTHNLRMNALATNFNKGLIVKTIVESIHFHPSKLSGGFCVCVSCEWISLQYSEISPVFHVICSEARSFH